MGILRVWNPPHPISSLSSTSQAQRQQQQQQQQQAQRLVCQFQLPLLSMFSSSSDIFMQKKWHTEPFLSTREPTLQFPNFFVHHMPYFEIF